MAASSSSVKTLLLSSSPPPPLMGTSSRSSSKLIILKSFIPRILTKAKTIIIQVSKNIHVVYIINNDFSIKKKNKNKLLKLGSLKLMMKYSCCSSQSQIMPVVPPPLIKRLPKKRDHNNQYYVCNYDSSWNSSNLLSTCSTTSTDSSSSSSTTCGDDDISTVELDDDDEAIREEGLSGYLHWLEGKRMAGKSSSNDQKKKEYSVSGDHNEIDRLAEMFIAESYEKFRVEKEESYRRFQDMLARSL